MNRETSLPSMRRLRLPRLLRAFRRFLSRVAHAHAPRGRSRTWTKSHDTRLVPPQLPPEVWETILEFLWNDRHALAACALTCRSFVPAVRRLVFHTVRLTDEPSPSHPESTYARFVSVLHASPHVALSVRDLAITLSADDPHPTLPPILPRLHEVERLTLGFSGALFELSDTARERLPTYFHRVRRLRIDDARFDGTDLLEILCACPELAQLHLGAVRWRRSSLLPAFTPDLAAVVPPSPVVLEELVLRSPPPQVVAWLVKGPFTLRLSKVELLWDGSSDGKYVPELLQAAGSSLQDLTLAFPGWFSSTDAVDLSHNPALTWLHLDKIRIDGSQPRVVYIPDPVRLHTYAWIPAALSQIRSARLQQVHFSVELCKDGDLAVLDWEQIDAQLARLVRESGAALVTSLHVANLDYQPARYGVVDAVMYRLPRLRAAGGRLGVVYAHWPHVEECWLP